MPTQKTAERFSVLAVIVIRPHNFNMYKTWMKHRDQTNIKLLHINEHSGVFIS